LTYRNFKYTKEFKKLFKKNGFRIKHIINNYLDYSINEIIIRKDNQDYKKIRLLKDVMTKEYGFSFEAINVGKYEQFDSK
jgi:hypothetical protein